jgi:WD40 repeat protein
MKFKLLKWIYHGKSEKKRLSIFSIDIQPFGNLILTCGQDFLVKIWVNETKQIGMINEDPILILENHKNIINIIRWSMDGTKFASGGDDGFLLIYEKTPLPLMVLTWRVFHKFECHTGDIIDLTWCSNCAFIATASLDNSVIVWTLDNKSILIKLSGHKGWVKGISWDPTGKFIATQSDDRKIIIWKTNSWKIIKKVKIKSKNKLTQNEIKSNFFSRLNWSTCGRYLLVCNSSFDRKKSSLFVLDRLKKFKKNIYLTGLELSVRIIRPSFRLYKNISKATLDSYYSFGTTGGMVNIASISSLKYYMCFKYLLKNQIIDLSWASDGYTLICCSQDGYVFFLNFSSKELGKIVSLNEHRLFINRYYSTLNNLTVDIVCNSCVKTKACNEKIKRIIKNNINKSRILKKCKKRFSTTNFIFFKPPQYASYLLNFYNYIQVKKVIYCIKKKDLIEIYPRDFIVIELTNEKIIYETYQNNYYKFDFFTIPVQSGKNMIFYYFLIFKKNKIYTKIKFIKKKRMKTVMFVSKISIFFSYNIFLLVIDCFGNIITINTENSIKIIFKKLNNNLTFLYHLYIYNQNLKILLELSICSGLIKPFLILFNYS